MSQLPGAPEAAYHVASPSGQEGPMTLDQLLEGVVSGRYLDTVPVWWAGQADWIALAWQPELAAALEARRSNAATVPAQVAPAPAPASAPQPAPAAQTAPAAVPGPSDDERDAIFAGLVKDSWKFHHLVEDTAKVDEVLLGALITSTLDTGRALIDLTSDGSNHFLRFEHPDDRSRVTMAITHLTRTVPDVKALGQRASVVIGYGEPVKNFGRVWSALKEEAKSGYIGGADPGTVTVDADVTAGYLYMQIDLYWKLDDYIGEDMSIDYPTLTSHVDATIHALRKFLKGRIGD